MLPLIDVTFKIMIIKFESIHVIALIDELEIGGGAVDGWLLGSGDAGDSAAKVDEKVFGKARTIYIYSMRVSFHWSISF